VGIDPLSAVCRQAAKRAARSITYGMDCFFSFSVLRGPFTKELAKCILASTTEDARIKFVKWVFSNITQHLTAKSQASISEQQQNECDQTTAILFMKLLTGACREKGQGAIKFEGQIAEV
jgi:hypothetical protein